MPQSPVTRSNPKPIGPVMGNPLRGKRGTRCKSKPSKSSMRSSQHSLLRNLPSTMRADSSPPLLTKIPPSRGSNAPPLTEPMEAALRRHMLPECEQSPEVSRNQAAPLAERTLLERMGLENQTLMMRLGLPLKTSWDLARGTSLPSDLGARIEVPSSNVPVMMKGMTTEIMPGTGRNLVEGPRGAMSRMQSCQLLKKLTSSRTPTLLTSNEHSKVWNPSRIARIFPLSSGKMSSQIGRLTSQHWLKTNSQESLPMMKSLTLETTLRSPQNRLGNLNPRSHLTWTGFTLGRNIQWQFYGHTLTDKTSSPIMASISSDSSWQVSTPITMLSMTKLPGNSSMGTKNSLSLIPINSPILPTKSSCLENTKGEPGEGMATLLAPARVEGMGGTSRSEQEVLWSSPFVVNSTKQWVANNSTASSSTNAQTVPRPVTPNLTVPIKRRMRPVN